MADSGLTASASAGWSAYNISSAATEKWGFFISDMRRHDDGAMHFECLSVISEPKYYGQKIIL